MAAQAPRQRRLSSPGGRDGPRLAAGAAGPRRARRAQRRRQLPVRLPRFGRGRARLGGNRRVPRRQLLVQRRRPARRQAARLAARRPGPAARRDRLRRPPRHARRQAGGRPDRRHVPGHAADARPLRRGRAAGRDARPATSSPARDWAAGCGSTSTRTRTNRILHTRPGRGDERPARSPDAGLARLRRPARLRGWVQPAAGIPPRPGRRPRRRRVRLPARRADSGGARGGDRPRTPPRQRAGLPAEVPRDHGPRRRPLGADAPPPSR